MRVIYTAAAVLWASNTLLCIRLHRRRHPGYGPGSVAANALVAAVFLRLADR